MRVADTVARYTALRHPPREVRQATRAHERRDHVERGAVQSEDQDRSQGGGGHRSYSSWSMMAVVSSSRLASPKAA